MTTQEILRACCAEEATRFAIDAPFVQGDYVGATNGHIVARLPISKCDWVDAIRSTERKAPPLMNLPWEGKRLPAIPLPRVSEKAPMERCPGCRGSKTCVCDCGHEHECCNCDESGMVPVLEKSINLGPVILAAVYVRLLQSFGVTEVEPLCDGTRTAPVCWRVGDVTGMLMPCSE